jgi:hypothetical protein
MASAKSFLVASISLSLPLLGGGNYIKQPACTLLRFSTLETNFLNVVPFCLRSEFCFLSARKEGRGRELAPLKFCVLLKFMRVIISSITFYAFKERK